MSLLPETKNIQSKMALFCRTGNEVELPGTTPNRFHHYRRLIFNIIEEHLESSFPIANEFIDSDVWDEMLDDFFSKHDCQSYQVWQIAGEFYKYAEKENYASKYQLPFLNDLLKFEWEELRLYNMENIKSPSYNNEGDILNDSLSLNPEHVLFQLEYPIHIQTPINAIEKKGNYFVLLYREKETGKVQFMDLSVWYALVIEQLSKSEVTLTDLLNEAPKLFGEIDIEVLTESTMQFVEDLKSKQFVLGYKI